MKGLEKESKDTTITFRTNSVLKEKLELFAVKESRSLSNAIEILLTKGIEELNTTKKRK